MAARPIFSESRRRPVRVAVALCIVMVAVLLVIQAIIPSVSAENVTPVTTSFITIDPIGNHTVGDVFFINGTTNLPVTEKFTIIFQTYLEFGRPVMKSDKKRYLTLSDNFSIIPITQGTNRWSVNVTDFAIQNLSTNGCHGWIQYSPTDLRCDPENDHWLVFVGPHYDTNFGDFILLPAKNVVPSNVPTTVLQTPVTTPFITIDPIGNHTVGDVFFINGTTNLPVSENLIVGILSNDYTPGGNRGQFFYSVSVPVMTNVNETNRWSVNVTDIGMWQNRNYLFEISSGKKVLCNKSPVCVEPEVTIVLGFTLLPANTRPVSTPSPTKFTSPVNSSSTSLSQTPTSTPLAPISTQIPLSMIGTCSALIASAGIFSTIRKYGKKEI